MQLTDKPRQSDRYAVREIDGLFFVMDPDTSELHSLNEVGSVIWGLLDGSRTIADVTAQVAELYDVNSETATSDTLAFLSEMSAKGLIVL